MLTLRQVFVFVFILGTLAMLVALVPMNVSSAPLQAPALQDTVVPPSGYPVPVTGGGMSPILVIGLLVLVGIAIVVVALALTNTSRSSDSDLPPR